MTDYSAVVIDDNVGRTFGRRFLLNGEELTLKQIAGKYDLNLQTLIQRVKRGYPIELAAYKGRVVKDKNGNFRKVADEEGVDVRKGDNAMDVFMDKFNKPKKLINIFSVIVYKEYVSGGVTYRKARVPKEKEKEFLAKHKDSEVVRYEYEANNVQ